MSDEDPTHGRGPKRVATRVPVLDVIADRWSPRSFAATPPSDDALRALFEAARLAPSAHNTQPARYLLGRKGRGTTWQRLFDCLMEHNQRWAGSAPVLVLAAVLRERYSADRGQWVPYPHAMHDLGLAVMSIILQARALDLYTHPLAGFDEQRAHAAFALPERYEAGLIIAVGHLGPVDALPEALRAREVGPRTRMPVDELVYDETWGAPSTLFTDDE